DGHTQRSAYATTDVFFKSIYEATNQTTLELSLGGGFAKNDYPHTWLNSAHPLEVRPKFQDDRQEKRQFNTDFHLFGILDNGLRHSSRAYFYQTLAESYFNENDPFQEIPGNEVLGSGTRSLGQKLGVIEQFDFQFGQKDYWIAGADLQVDRVDAVPDSILYGKQQVNGFAVFLQNEYNITPRLTSTIGVRYDVNHLVGHKTLSALSPKVAFVYQFSEALTMRTLLGQAFRAPTIAERFFKVEQAGGILFDPNPDLDPERMTLSVETGFRWQPTVTVDLDLAVFRYHYEDLIYWVDIAGERGTPFPFFQVRNLNKALMQGLETTVTYRPLRQLDFSLNYTFLHSRDLSANREDDLLAYKPCHTLYGQVNTSIKRLALNVTGRYQSKTEEVFLYPLQAPDAFVVINTKAVFTLNNSLKLNATVNNLFNTEYEELARFRMPGRTFLFGFESSF
ncbi:MAG TPA: TonB-dependent receptor, partial [Calditrichia bacterium]|nr:TonB-dependent receptor [Calditrichia bacterium]